MFVDEVWQAANCIQVRPLAWMGPFPKFLKELRPYITFVMPAWLTSIKGRNTQWIYASICRWIFLVKAWVPPTLVASYPARWLKIAPLAPLTSNSAPSATDTIFCNNHQTLLQMVLFFGGWTSTPPKTSTCSLTMLPHFVAYARISDFPVNTQPIFKAT